jgi:hypothetical protein
MIPERVDFTMHLHVTVPCDLKDRVHYYKMGTKVDISPVALTGDHEVDTCFSQWAMATD